MAFAKPGRQPPQEETPRRTAVKINVATDVRDRVTARIATGVDEQDVRSKQKLIGPSEVGNPCDFCLGVKLAGLKPEEKFNWSAWGGTQVHKGLSKMFGIEAQAQMFGSEVHGYLKDGLKSVLQEKDTSRWLVDHRVTVGEIDGREISGELDLFDIEGNCVVDFKYPMDRTLDRVRFSGQSKPEYEVQADLYGRGLVREGWKVTHVAVYFLAGRSTHITEPRQLWSKGFWWAKEWDEGNAIRALERATGIAERIRLVGADFVLPTLEKRGGCFDCKRYEKSLNQLEGVAA